MELTAQPTAAKARAPLNAASHLSNHHSYVGRTVAHREHCGHPRQDLILVNSIASGGHTITCMRRLNPVHGSDCALSTTFSDLGSCPSYDPVLLAAFSNKGKFECNDCEYCTMMVLGMITYQLLANPK
jgi:hypothetical protein